MTAPVADGAVGAIAAVFASPATIQPAHAAHTAVAAETADPIAAGFQIATALLTAKPFDAVPPRVADVVLAAGPARAATGDLHTRVTLLVVREAREPCAARWYQIAAGPVLMAAAAGDGVVATIPAIGSRRRDAVSSLADIQSVADQAIAAGLGSVELDPVGDIVLEHADHAAVARKVLTRRIAEAVEITHPRTQLGGVRRRQIGRGAVG